MGRPKALVELNGRPLVAHAITIIEAAGLRPLVVAKPDSTLPELPCRVIREPGSPRHPLAGILAALDAPAGAPIVVLPCDMPLVPPGLVRHLAALDEPLAVVGTAGGIEPLLGRYTPQMADLLREGLACEAPLRDVVRAAGARILTGDELASFGAADRILSNINTPADLARVRRLLRE